MRYSYSDLLNSFLDDTGNTGSADATLLAFFKRKLVSRYQQTFAELTNQLTQEPRTASTVANQQYYHLPSGIVDIEGVTVTVGSYPWPLITIDSELEWEKLNSMPFSITAIPRFIFPRKNDFGIWPIPQGVYTITFNYHIRDRSLGVADYSTSTVTVTNNSQTVTGAASVWTAAMTGRWFVMDDPTKQGQGYWYRIASVASNTSLTLETSYEQTTVSGATYRICESPELPEELHISLAHGTTADYFAGPRSDISKATWFDNMFWTGSGLEKDRDGKTFMGGILGAKQRYAGRSDGAIVNKKGLPWSYTDKLWATRIS